MPACVFVYVWLLFFLGLYIVGQDGTVWFLLFCFCFLSWFSLFAWCLTPHPPTPSLFFIQLAIVNLARNAQLLRAFLAARGTSAQEALPAPAL
eukprot:m.128031 g.128031  ORF g.128031 m.128031 type:complete len:93 (-) comp9741_c1_seq1:2794-3072(-)